MSVRSCARLPELHDSTSRGAFAASCDLTVGTLVQSAVELQLTGTRLPRAWLLLLLRLLPLPLSFAGQVQDNVQGVAFFSSGSPLITFLSSPVLRLCLLG